jgi:hemolysin-activating ACP:hemolysin acyltransferase
MNKSKKEEEKEDNTLWSIYKLNSGQKLWVICLFSPDKDGKQRKKLTGYRNTYAKASRRRRKRRRKRRRRRTGRGMRAMTRRRRRRGRRSQTKQSCILIHLYKILENSY